MAAMDIPQVLEVLRPGEDWGPMAHSGVTYVNFAPFWNGVSAIPTEAQMNAEWANLESTAVVRMRDKVRNAAIALATFQDRTTQLIRAELLLTMDELNILRQWITDFKVAVAGAATLAALKTAVAALPNLAQRTAAQIKPALIVRISTPDAD